ncbi:MAG: riboflavin kinase [Candidatus Binatota bacterium]
MKRIREEKKFSSAETLVEQMKKDALSAQEILNHVGKDERVGVVR